MLSFVYDIGFEKGDGYISNEGEEKLYFKSTYLFLFQAKSLLSFVGE